MTPGMIERAGKCVGPRAGFLSCPTRRHRDSGSGDVGLDRTPSLLRTTLPPADPGLRGGGMGSSQASLSHGCGWPLSSLQPQTYSGRRTQTPRRATHEGSGDVVTRRVLAGRFSSRVSCCFVPVPGISSWPRCTVAEGSGEPGAVPK